MVSRLRDNLPRPAKAQFYDPSVQASLYAHLNILMNGRKQSIITIDLNKADQFRGDFIGLLIDQQIPIDLHPIVCEMNGFLDPSDYDGVKVTFVIPFQEDVNDIVVRHKSLDK